MQKTLRHYQRDAVKSVFREWMLHRSCLVHLATGAGKSIVAASIIDRVLKNGKRALYIADSDDLCYQPLRTITDVCGEIPALEKAKFKAVLNAKVVVASMQTLSKRARLERFPPDHFDYCICDEAHRGSTAKQKIYEYFRDAFVCGMTATPYRANLRDLSKYYETVAISLPMIGLVEQGFAPPISVLTLPVEVDLNAVRQSMGAEGKDYNQEDLDTCIAPYYQKIAEMIKEYAWDRKIIAFLPLIKSSEAFAAIMRNNHIRCVHVDGTTPDRQLIYRDLQQGKLDMISNSQVASTGVDLPEVDCILNLRATRSPAFYQQVMGRACRPWPGCIDDLPEQAQAPERQSRIARSPKPDTMILDLLWQHESLATVRPGDMFANNPEEARRIFERSKDSRTPLELLALAKEVQREKELTLVEHLKAAADKHRGRDMRAEHIGVYLDDPKLLEYEPVARWEMAKPSADQLGVIERFGVEIGSVKTKGQASAIISACIKRREAGLATLKMVRVLRREGVDNAARLPFNEAKAILDDILGGAKKGVDTTSCAPDSAPMSNKQTGQRIAGLKRDAKGRLLPR